MSDQIGILARKLQQTTARHGVIASNIANVDTPGYRARDLRFSQALNEELGLTATAPGHIPSSPVVGTAQVDEAGGEMWIDENNVELDQEVAKMTENAVVYQAGVTLLSTKIRMYKEALKTK